MKVLPRVAVVGAIILFACAMHQELALQTQWAWIPTVALMAVVTLAIFATWRGTEILAPIPEPWTGSWIQAFTAIGFIAILFIALLAFNKHALCAGEWRGGTYCESLRWL